MRSSHGIRKLSSRQVAFRNLPQVPTSPHINKALTSVRCASFDLLVRASEREQLFALGMLCTGTKRGQFFWGLDWTACPCSHKFCVAIADVRKRTFHCAPCNPRVECIGVSPGTIHIQLSTSGRAEDMLDRDIAKIFPAPPMKYTARQSLAATLLNR
jgi:hypothetical protein